MYLKKHVTKYADSLYSIVRILVGLLFLQHGAQKLFGVLGGSSVELISLMGLAGVIEFFGGLAIALGFFTRLAAIISGLEMVVAYFMFHASKSLIPINNGGELAALFLLTFVLFLVYGAGKWSLEKNLLKKELF